MASAESNEVLSTTFSWAEREEPGWWWAGDAWPVWCVLGRQLRLSCLLSCSNPISPACPLGERAWGRRGTETQHGHRHHQQPLTTLHPERKGNVGIISLGLITVQSISVLLEVMGDFPGLYMNSWEWDQKTKTEIWIEMRRRNGKVKGMKTCFYFLSRDSPLGNLLKLTLELTESLTGRDHWQISHEYVNQPTKRRESIRRVGRRFLMQSYVLVLIKDLNAPRRLNVLPMKETVGYKKCVQCATINWPTATAWRRLFKLAVIRNTMPGCERSSKWSPAGFGTF